MPLIEEEFVFPGSVTVTSPPSVRMPRR